MYWGPNDTEDDGEEEKLTVHQLLVDYIIGGIEFCDNVWLSISHRSDLLFCHANNCIIVLYF